MRWSSVIVADFSKQHDLDCHFKGCSGQKCLGMPASNGVCHIVLPASFFPVRAIAQRELRPNEYFHKTTTEQCGY